jgi:hypothetical protein
LEIRGEMAFLNLENLQRAGKDGARGVFQSRLAHYTLAA